MPDIPNILPEAEGTLVLGPNKSLLQHVLFLDVALESVLRQCGADLQKYSITQHWRAQVICDVHTAAVFFCWLLLPLVGPFHLNHRRFSYDHQAVFNDDLLVLEIYPLVNVCIRVLALFVKHGRLLDEGAEVSDDPIFSLQAGDFDFAASFPLRNFLIRNVSLNFILRLVQIFCHFCYSISSWSVHGAGLLIGGFLFAHFIKVVHNMLFGKRELFKAFSTEYTSDFPSLEVWESMPHNIQAFIVFTADSAVVCQMRVLLSTEHSVPPCPLGFHLEKRQGHKVSATSHTEKVRRIANKVC